MPSISRAVCAALFLFCSLFFTAVSAAETPVPSVPTDSHSDIAWFAARYWLQSADCARLTHAVLVVCLNGKLYPLSHVDSGDDPGHALALGLYSALTGSAVQTSDILSLNAYINYLGLILLAALLLTLNLPAAFVLLIICGPIVASKYNEATPHPAQLGVVALATILPLAILGLLPDLEKHRKTTLTWLVVGVFSLAVAALFRQSIGMMGAVAAFLALACNAIWFRRRVLAFAVLAVAILVSNQSPYFILRARDAAYNLAQTDVMERHGSWHSIYIGLGAVDNDLGIAWDDANAFNRVRQVNPKAEWLSKEYFDILRGEYFKIVTERPLTVANIYFRKFELTMQETFRRSGPFTLGLLLLGLGGVAIALRVFLRKLPFGPVDAVLAVSTVFIGLLLAQSVIVIFRYEYIFPVQLFLILVAGAIVELAWRTIRRPTLSPVG
jgi:hypothetical protein